MNFIKFGNETV